MEPFLLPQISGKQKDILPGEETGEQICNIRQIMEKHEMVTSKYSQESLIPWNGRFMKDREKEGKMTILKIGVR